MSALHISRRPGWAPLPALELTFLSAQAGIALPDPIIDDVVAREVLRTGNLEIIGRMPWSSNATFLCEISDDAGHKLLAIYKPRRGERPLWDFAEGTLCQRETAAATVSAMLGWSLIPDTVLRDGPVDVGSVCRFYDHDPEQHYFEIFAGREDTFRRFAAFDVIVNNTDRKGGHVLLDERGNVWGIDHGVCFHEQYKLRTVIWEFAGEPLPPAIIDDIQHFAVTLDQSSACAELTALLSPAEFVALQRRTERLLHLGRFPVPSGDYHDYPWPTI